MLQASQMGSYSSNSEIESDMSESEKDYYAERFYNQLKAGKYRTKNPNATLRCPFCEGKKKQEFQFKDLLQHASGIGAGSSKRSMEMRLKHLALAEYLKEDLSIELDIVIKPQLEEQANEQPNSADGERFVWPWKGIVASIFSKAEYESEEYWLSKFELYKPKEAHVLHGEDDHRGYVVLEFGTEWTGFRQVMKLDTDFLTDNHGRMDWYSRKEYCPGSDLYAWIGRAEDYNSVGLVGDYLRQKAVLKTVSEVSQDSLKEKNQTVAKLVGEIESTNKSISQVETKYTERNMSLLSIMEERDFLHQARIQEMQCMQQLARDHTRRMIDETESLQRQIYTSNAELDRWCQKLSEREKSTMHERRKFEEEKKKKTESLILASEEQVKAKDDIAELLEKHQREEQALRDTLLKLEKDLNDEHKLKLERVELEGQLKVLKCMNVMGAHSEKDKKKEIEEMEEKLQEMIEEMSEQEDFKQILERKEQSAKKELEDARQEFITVLPRCLKRFISIGVKKFGEINAQPFLKVCKNKYKGNQKASLEAAKELHLKWQNEILDSTWHPFKINEVEGKLQKVIDEDDHKLLALKEDLGEEVYEAVVAALKELVNYEEEDSSSSDNPTGRRSVKAELWNFKIGRRATLTEAIAYTKRAVKKMK